MLSMFTIVQNTGTLALKHSEVDKALNITFSIKVFKPVKHLLLTPFGCPAPSSYDSACSQEYDSYTKFPWQSEIWKWVQVFSYMNCIVR